MLIHPTPETPDDTPTENIRFPSRIRNALAEIGLKTVGEIRESSDGALRSIQNLGHGSVAYLRQVLGTQKEPGSTNGDALMAEPRVDFNTAEPR